MKTQINQLIQKASIGISKKILIAICAGTFVASSAFATGEENNAKAASALKRNSPVQKTYNGKLPQLH